MTRTRCARKRPQCQSQPPSTGLLAPPTRAHLPGGRRSQHLLPDHERVPDRGRDRDNRRGGRHAARADDECRHERLRGPADPARLYRQGLADAARSAGESEIRRQLHARRPRRDLRALRLESREQVRVCRLDARARRRSDPPRGSGRACGVRHARGARDRGSRRRHGPGGGRSGPRPDDVPIVWFRRGFTSAPLLDSEL